MHNTKNQDNKDYHSELKQIWNENHQADLDPELTILDLDVSHQKSWRQETSRKEVEHS
jgi:hypothetical protein